MNETQKQVNIDKKITSTSAVDVVDGLLAEAVAIGASDIHIDPRAQDVVIRFRIDGEISYASQLSSSIHAEVISRLKIISGARTDLHSVPQDGRFRTPIGDTQFNVRVSFMPTFHGENAVIRILSGAGKKLDSFASLGFTPSHVEKITRALSNPHGLILVTGPTGCGKTTTLRVCLGLKSQEPLSVMTLEDPVEYEVPGVRHVHIREMYGVSFASGLRSALRQDPDVIMVGEIRDAETARTAVQTALTGHLVLSTLHTTSALDTIIRLAHMGVERYLIAATVKLIVNQRLVRTLCRECGGLGFDARTNIDKACLNCRGTGLRGRGVIAEVIEVDDEIRELIEKAADQKTIMEYLNARGYISIKDDAHEKVEWGMTVESEVIKSLNS